MVDKQQPRPRYALLLREARVRLLLTQEQLAARSGVSVRTIRNFEAGRIPFPRAASVRSLADALALTGDERLAFEAAALSGESVADGHTVPRQLPAAPRSFVGRTEEFAALDKILLAAGGGSVVISAIGGVGGVGKTALAVHWAQRNAHLFPDGQLFLNLRGFQPASEPMQPAAALHTLLDGMGVDPKAIPSDVDARVGLYRTLSADRRMLVVLDDAQDSGQVAPLLPSGPTCAVLVTSRRALGGLAANHGAHSLRLDILPDAEARALLLERLGHERLDAEAAATAALLRHCGGLPLALNIVAARAVSSTTTLAALAAELDEATDRLDALDAGEINANLRAVFATSYDALDADAAALFGLLGLVPGPDIGALGAAALIAEPVARARKLLRELEDAHLVSQPDPGRYRVHDLLRLYAAEHVDEDIGRAALARLVECYAQAALVASEHLRPHGQSGALDSAKPDWFDPPSFEDLPTALAWFDTEQQCLLATLRLADARGWSEPAWRLAWAQECFYYWRGRLHEHLTVWSIGLTAATRLANPALLALAHRGLGVAYSRGDHPDEGLEHLSEAIRLAEEVDDARLQARTYRSMAWTWARLGDLDHALDNATQAVRLYERLDDPAALAAAMNAEGWYAALLGRYEQARRRCTAALALAREHNHYSLEGGTLDSLGYVAHHTGDQAQAVAYYRQSLKVYQALGTTYGEANTLSRLGDAHAGLGEHEQAREVWQRAVELYTDQRRTTEAADVASKLAALT